VKLPEEILEYFRKQGSEGGKKRAAKLSAGQRKEIALKAIQTRWAKAKKKSSKKKTRKSRGAK